MDLYLATTIGQSTKIGTTQVQKLSRWIMKTHLSQYSFALIVLAQKSELSLND